MKNEKTIYIIIAAVFFAICAGNIYNTAKYHQLRGLCDQYREQLTATENANKELTDRIGRITEAVGRLYETTERNVTDARGIVETVEVLRTQIQELENICYCSDSIDNYYNHLDNELRKEGLMID